MAIIQIEDLSKTYATAENSRDKTGGKEPVYILKDVNLGIAEGEFHIFLGWSGCGKSTLLNIIAGFIEKSSGQVLVDSQPVVKPGFDRGVVFQNADSAIFSWLSVWKNV
ncbi:MAG: ATP-binding cassette domain-containing protein, partial [Spirochaetaceae bacterium]|nr:ATP-binding cassette domain-containing protein [Spirochaetaceae bacterium]